MLNVGLVGCGKIADGHVEAIQRLPFARLLAVCDVEPVFAEQLACRYSIPNWYSDCDRMLANHRLDVMHIATPPQFHLPLTRQCLNAGCHVFLEKPLAPEAQEARRLINCVQDAGRKMTINYWYNFENHALALRAFIEEGHLGDPVHIESYYGYDLTGAYGEAFCSDDRHWVHQLPGQLFQNVIDHAVNKVSPFLSDARPLEVIARAYSGRKRMAADACDMLDELRVMILSDGVSAYVTFCSEARPVGHFMRIYGTKNTVHLDFVSRTMLVEEKQPFPGAAGRVVPPFRQSWQTLRQATRNAREFAACRFHFFAGLNRLVTLFYESILYERPVPISYAEILRVSTLVDDICSQVSPTVIA